MKLHTYAYPTNITPNGGDKLLLLWVVDVKLLSTKGKRVKRSPLKRTAGLRRSQLSPISKKRKDKMKTRRYLVEAQLWNHPHCQRCGLGAVDVHEIINRSQTKDAELRPELFLSLCRPCHSWITTNPRKSKAHGFALPPWMDDPRGLLHAAKHRKLPCANNNNCEDDHI